MFETPEQDIPQPPPVDPYGEVPLGVESAWPPPPEFQLKPG